MTFNSKAIPAGGRAAGTLSFRDIVSGRQRGASSVFYVFWSWTCSCLGITVVGVYPLVGCEMCLVVLFVCSLARVRVGKAQY